MAASLARGAAASVLGLGTAFAVSGGRESQVYAYVADRMVGVFTWLPPEEAHALTIQLAQAGFERVRSEFSMQRGIDTLVSKLQLSMQVDSQP